MSEIGDIVEDYRQHTRWVGPTDARVAREVPAEMLRAIEAYEWARTCRHATDERYKELRDEGHHPELAQTVLNQCSQYGRLMEQWWGHLQALLPREPGWYPHGPYVYGYAKRSKRGLELTRDPASSRWPDPDRAAAWALAWGRRRGEEERVRGFCEQVKGAIR